MDLLRPAVDLLRAALRQMDDDDVPANLRSLTDSSARRLPPPLLRRALEELDRSEWLRTETIAHSPPEPGTAAAAFLERPRGWESKVGKLTEAAEISRKLDDAATVERRLAEAVTTIGRLEDRIARLQGEVAGAHRDAKELNRTRLAAAESARRRAEEESARHARTVEEAAGRQARLEERLAETETRVEMLRQLLEKERRASPPVDGHGASRGWFPSDPKGMAVELDRIAVAVTRPPPTARAVVAGRRRSRLRLPGGIRPDRPEAVRLLAGEAPTWLIDGYNVAFHLGGGPDATSRARVQAGAARLVSAGAPRSRAVVVFDSAVEESDESGDRRVRIVYAESADEWILERAGPGDVVVSSDRRVRDGAERAGALGIWSEALAGWIASSPVEG
ncbi:hypothetical protein BH23ACT5_BH23ACT5_11890 [soil metagenome]